MDNCNSIINKMYLKKKVLGSCSSSDTCWGVTFGKSFQFMELQFHHLFCLKARISGPHEACKRIKYDNEDSRKTATVKSLAK